MNRVVLIGRLTKDPELRFTPGSGAAVTTFTLAVDRRQSKNGQREADFIPIVAWNKVAENVANYMSKGKLVGVSGRIQTRSYEAKDGTRRYVTEVIADEVQFLEKGSGSKGRTNMQGTTQDSAGSNTADSKFNQAADDFGEDITPIDDGDIPF